MSDFWSFFTNHTWLMNDECCLPRIHLNSGSAITARCLHHGHHWWSWTEQAYGWRVRLRGARRSTPQETSLLERLWNFSSWRISRHTWTKLKVICPSVTLLLAGCWTAWAPKFLHNLLILMFTGTSSVTENADNDNLFIYLFISTFCKNSIKSSEEPKTCYIRYVSR